MKGSIKGRLEPLSSDEPFPAIFGFKAQTIPALFLERCQRTPEAEAHLAKDRGIYWQVTWKEYLEHVRDFCLGLVELGLERGDRVAIMGDSCPEWVYADLSAQAAGAVTYGVYPTSSMPELKYLMENGGAKFFVAEDQEYVDKILLIADELPTLKKIVVIDTRAMFLYDNPRIISFKEVKQIGEKRNEKESHLFEKLVSLVKPEDVANIIYTSGTTGPPKAAMITHFAYLWGWLGITQLWPKIFLEGEPQRAVAYLPLAHILAKLTDVYIPMMTNVVTVFPEEAETMAETLFEVFPTVIMGPPRIFEKFAAQVLVGIATSTRVKRALYRVGMSIGRHYIGKKWAGDLPWYLVALYRFAHWAVFRPILNKMGMKQIKLALVGASPVPKEMVMLWQIWGVNMLEMYGQTEAGPVAIQVRDFAEPGSAGLPAPRTEVRITAEGEAIVKGPANFLGYLDNEKATVETKKNGFVYTGDIVRMNDAGEIQIVDRLKDIIIPSGGKNISPSEVEKALKGSPYMSEVVVFGDGRKYLSALIEIDFDTASEWARANGIIYTSFTSLTTDPKIYELIKEEIDKANTNLARVAQVKKFRIIPKELNPENEADPVTPTRKIQRNKMYERFKDLVESMYSKEEEALIMAEVEELKESKGEIRRVHNVNK